MYVNMFLCCNFKYKKGKKGHEALYKEIRSYYCEGKKLMKFNFIKCLNLKSIKRGLNMN